ncbi:hypothetical protein CRG98_024578 [Punica granatum]|uniref:Uncharacterized protein n=1 Tax=Punica granatum TaxID=22663 RepID=A0A2I0JFI6_PUNGR|nr:hypothetical protein CRG98_024578 [Punica granatum]
MGLRDRANNLLIRVNSTIINTLFAIYMLPVIFLPLLVHACQHPILVHRLQQRTSDQSSGHYSQSGNQRRTCGHIVINYRREARSTRKAQEGNQKNRRTTNPKNSRGRHCGTIHRRIAGASEGIQYGTLKIPLDTKMTHGASKHILEASCLSRGTPELSQTPFLTGLPGGLIHGQVNDTRKWACTHPRTTRTMEQVSYCLSRLIFVSRVSFDPGKGTPLRRVLVLRAHSVES